MDVILVLLVAYVLAGSIWPQIVRNRPMFLLGAAGVALAIVLPLVTKIIEALSFAVLVLGAQAWTLEDLRRIPSQFRSFRR